MSNVKSIVIVSYTVNNLLDKIDGTAGTYTSANYESKSTNTYIVKKDTTLTLASVYTAPETINTNCTFNGHSTSYGTTAVTPSTTAPKAANGTTYYMWFTRKTFALTLNKGTGIASTSGAGTYKYGKQVNINATVSAGYTWKNWTKNSGNAPANANNKETTVTITSATTLTANATANVYKINFYQGNGTSTAGNTKLGEMNATYGESVKLTTYADLGGIFPYSIEDKNQNGNTNYAWTFAGWCTTETGTSRNYTNGKEFTYNIAGDLNLYAVGSKKFYFSGGIAPLGIISSTTQYWNPYSRDLAYLTSINIPAKVDIDGWEFIGYKGGSSTANSTVTFAPSVAGTSIKPEYDKYGTNRSVYRRDTTISYNANVGTGTTTSTVVKQYYNSGYGNTAGTANNGANVSTPSFTLATNNFTKTGYNFSKWADGSASGTQYAAGATYTGFTPAVDSADTTKTMYAIWSEKTAKLTYNANGHGTAPSEVTMKYTSATNAASAITATNYTFNGWNTKADGTGTSYAAGAQVKAANTIPNAMTLYAQWSYNETPNITRSDYNTFTYNTTEGAAYYVSTTQSTAPAAGTTAASTTFGLDTWTTAKNTGDLTLEEGKTYYVWAKDATTKGSVSANKATIVVRTVTRVQTNATLTAKYESSSGGNVSFSSNKAYVLNGTKIYATASPSSGYGSATVTLSTGSLSSNIATITANTTITASATYNATPSITRSDYNTFTYDATAGAAYYVSTTQTTAPAAGTAAASTTFGLDTWTTATDTGDLELTAGTYYVWVKNATTKGSVSANKATIAAYTISRSVGTGTTLTTRYDSTSSDTGTDFTSSTVMLAGTSVWAKATRNNGYTGTVTLKHGSTTMTASGSTFTVNATEKVTSGGATYNATPSITVSDYNTFTYTATAGKAYYVSTTQTTAPAAGTEAASTTFALNTWTTAKNTGNLTLEEGTTYYVWVKNATTKGSVSANNATIAVRKVVRSTQGKGTTLTTKYNSSSGSSFTGTVYVLNGSKVNVTGGLTTGYQNLVLKNGNTTISAGDQTISADATFSSSATAKTYTITLKAGNGVSKVALSGWTNTGTSSMTKTMSYDSELDLSSVTVTFKNGYSGTNWTKTSGAGTLNGTTFKVGDGVTTLTVAATTLAAPAPSISTTNTTKVYGESATTLTATQSTTYDSGVSVYYKFGNSTSASGTYTYGTASTETTSNVSATSHYGTKYYKVQAYATDGTLTSTTATWSSSMYVKLTAATITFNGNNGTVSGTTPLYAKKNETTLYTTNTGTTAATAPTATRTGYTFTGWYKEAAATTKVLNADGSFTGTAISGYTTATAWATTDNKTLYAGWTANNYDIIYDFDEKNNLNLWDTINVDGRYNFSYNNSSHVTTISGKGQAGWEECYQQLVLTSGHQYKLSFTYNIGALTPLSGYDGLGIQVLNAMPTKSDNTTKVIAAEYLTANTSGTKTITFTATDTVYLNINLGLIEDNINVSGIQLGNFKITDNGTYDENLGTLPQVTGTKSTFAGWYTGRTNGTRITTSTTIGTSNTFYGEYIKFDDIKIVEGNINDFTDPEYAIEYPETPTITYTSSDTSKLTIDTTNGTFAGVVGSGPTTATMSVQLTYPDNSVVNASRTVEILEAKYENSANISSIAVGRKKYNYDLKTANSYIAENGTIKALKSTTEYGTVTINKSITLNTNGKTLTRGYNSTTGESGMLNVTSGTLTLAGSGTLYYNHVGNNNVLGPASNAHAIYLKGGNFTTSGTPTIRANNAHAIYVAQRTNLNLQGGNIYAQGEYHTISTATGDVTYYDSLVINNTNVLHDTAEANALCISGVNSSTTFNISGNSRIGNGISGSGTKPAIQLNKVNGSTLNITDTSYITAGPYGLGAIVVASDCTINLKDNSRIYACNDNTTYESSYCIAADSEHNYNVGSGKKYITVNFDSAGYFYAAGRYVTSSTVSNLGINVNITKKGYFVSRYSKYMFRTYDSSGNNYYSVMQGSSFATPEGTADASDKTRKFGYINTMTGETTAYYIGNCYYYSPSI